MPIDRVVLTERNRERDNIELYIKDAAIAMKPLLFFIICSDKQVRSRNTIKMPRKPLRSSDEIYEALKFFFFIDDDGLLLPWTNKVWDDAVDTMQGTMSKEYIYLYLSQDRGGVFNRIHALKRWILPKTNSIIVS